VAEWASERVFYHIYPLGLCGAPESNDFAAPPEPRLQKLTPWLEHARSIGASALYLGPLFESSTHGYDTADYFAVDRRLGTADTLSAVCAAAHAQGIRVILDAVFNHVGRDFWAFRDLRANGRGSPYAGWFAGLGFDGRSPYGDPFTYEGWNGHLSLVKLNVQAAEVREHLFAAVRQWVESFDIDGLRLDAADCLEPDFLGALAGFCRGLKSDFWLLGETVHGDYRQWVSPSMLDSVTNYQCYKGLYSSHNDANYFEIAWSLNRQFGPQGIYRGMPLYNFADNHDVDRLASSLKNPAHLRPLYCILFTMPGIPSIYYGSEWGIEGRHGQSDRLLRPRLELAEAASRGPHAGLSAFIRRLAEIRRGSAALLRGDYAQVHVAARQLAYLRQSPGDLALVVVNADEKPVSLDLAVPQLADCPLLDLLSDGERFSVSGGRLSLKSVPAAGARILVRAP
jgi:cyclomaltodextrinase / maltogenic alpha-amylase / neopullulanase